MKDLVEVLVYAAALDVYRRINRGAVRTSRRETSAVLTIVDWNARPKVLES